MGRGPGRCPNRVRSPERADGPRPIPRPRPPVRAARRRLPCLPRAAPAARFPVASPFPFGTEPCSPNPLRHGPKSGRSRSVLSTPTPRRLQQKRSDSIIASRRPSNATPGRRFPAPAGGRPPRGTFGRRPRNRFVECEGGQIQNATVAVKVVCAMTGARDGVRLSNLDLARRPSFAPRSQALLGNARVRCSASRPGRGRDAKRTFAARRSQAELGNEGKVVCAMTGARDDWRCFGRRRPLYLPPQTQ